MANDNDIIARLKVEGLNQFKAELAQSSKSADGTTTAVQRMEKAIADATDPKDVQRLTKELEAVKVATEASQTAFESSKAKLRAYKEEATGLATILATMKSEGKQNTQTFKDIEKQFEATKKKAGQLSDQISDINQEIKSLGSDTRGIDNVVRGATLMANSFQLATGVQALFGKENKALTEGLLKLNGIMAVTQSIQQIGNELTREDSIVKQAASKATAFYATTMEMATGAVKLFRIALMGLGIGAVIFAVYELTKGFFGLGEQVEDNTKKQKENNDAIQESIDLIKERQREEQLGYNRIGGLYLQNGKLRKKTLEQQLKDALEIQEKWRQTTEFASTDSAEKFKEYLRKNGQEILAADKNVADLQKAIEDRNREAERKRKEAEKKRSGDQVQRIKQDIEELEILESFDKNSQRAIQAQIEWYEQLRASVDINSKEFKNLNEIIDLLQKKLAGKQKIEPIDLSGALKGIDPKVIEKRPLTLYERIFGSREENVDAQKRIENQVKGSLKIVSEINKYGQQISSIAEQAIQIRSANELQLLEDKKNRGLITEKEYEKQSAQIKNEAAQKKRKIDIANATAQIPVAVLSAYIAGLQIGGPAAPIVAGILAGVAGAFGLAQVALIASAPLPKFRDGGSVRKRLGLIKGKKHEQGGVPIEVEGDEFVMKSQATKKYGVKMLEDINNLRYNPIITANGKLSNKNKQDTRIYENLAIIGSYLKQGYKVDAQGNQILKEISDKLNNKSVYV